MAKRRSRQAEPEVDLDEVDTFHANKDKLLLEEAGNYGRNNDDSEESDEEVLNLNEESDDSADENIEGNDDEEEEEEASDEETGWGGKKDYYGGDDASDDEDAKQMAEEAAKQQKKHLQELSMEDYIDEDMDEGWKKVENTESESTAIDSKFVINKENSLESLDSKEKLKLLNQMFPELIPLLKELSTLKLKLANLQKKPTNEIRDLKSAALSSYLASISSYFAFFLDNLKANDNFTTMKDNQVMETILSCREIWRQANELPDDIEMIDSEHVDIEEPLDDEELLQESDEEDVSDSESEVSGEMEEFVDASESPSEDFTIDINSSRKIKKLSKAKVNDFTEGADDVDMEDKQRRKKTLRFYSSKIDQAANKNTEKLTGDSDLPYRERLFERQQRLVEEARKRGLAEKDDLGADLDNNDYNSEDDKLAGEINEKDIEYYESLKQGKQNQKNERRLAHELAVQAAKEGKLAELEEELGTSGKRAINYQILKNKGLTPHRKKEFRNSRVKKRIQYEKAKKKLSSVRQVYKGDAKGPYEGEKTGIKKNLSRSVKLV